MGLYLCWNQNHCPKIRTVNGNDHLIGQCTVLTLTAISGPTLFTSPSGNSCLAWWRPQRRHEVRLSDFRKLCDHKGRRPDNRKWPYVFQDVPAGIFNQLFSVNFLPNVFLHVQSGFLKELQKRKTVTDSSNLKCVSCCLLRNDLWPSGTSWIQPWYHC